MSADLADKVANGSIAQHQLIKVNQKSPKVPKSHKPRQSQAFFPRQSLLVGASLMRGSVNFESGRSVETGDDRGLLTWVRPEGAHVTGEYDVAVINMLRCVIDHVIYLRSSPCCLA